jgi:hypothetical protein
MRTPEITAWNTTMFPVINQSIRDAQAQIATGHRDIRDYTTDRTTPPTESTTNAANNVTRETQAILANSNASTTSATASSREVTTLRIRRLPFSASRNRLQHARSHLATIPAIATARAPRESQATLAHSTASTASLPASTGAATNTRTRHNRDSATSQHSTYWRQPQLNPRTSTTSKNPSRDALRRHPAIFPRAQQRPIRPRESYQQTTISKP